MNFKFKIRQEFIEIRKKIPNEYRRHAAHQAAVLLKTHPLFKQSQHIACYLPLQNEFDSLPLIEVIWQTNKYCYLPVLAKENSLHFVRYQYGDALHRNQYSILEPIKMERKMIAENLDMVITPLIAFDKQGHRLGTGGGYFDKTFAFLQNSENQKKCMVGLAYAKQQAEGLPVDPWDIPLASVITEKQILIFY